MIGVFPTVNASLGWHNNVSGLILSVPTNQRPSTYIFTKKNEELLAASVLFVHSGAFLVSQNGFINFFEIVQCYTIQVCSEPADRQVISTTLAAPQREL
jgi:hypothetical protein